MNEITRTNGGAELEPVTDRPHIVPLVDIYENEDEVLLKADLPGVTDKGLRVDLDENRLLIEGHPEEQPQGQLLSREFDLVDYRRTFVLPDGIDRSQISAELRGGVLTLRMPKSEDVKPRRIQVKSS